MEVSTGPKQVFPQTQTPAPDFTVREKAHKTQQVVHKKKKSLVDLNNTKICGNKNRTLDFSFGRHLAENSSTTTTMSTNLNRSLYL